MEVRSQSLPLFRAFQHNDLGDMYYIKEKVAIPSFIQGISTLAMAKVTMPALSVAIPSFIQGISTIIKNNCFFYKNVLSQSLPLFRAFQHFQSKPYIKKGEVGRNPFLYSGHFNSMV